MSEWKPIDTAPRNKLVFVRGGSGYTIHRTFITLAHKNVIYRPRDPWMDVQNTQLSERGWTPTEWREIPPGWLP